MTYILRAGHSSLLSGIYFWIYLLPPFRFLAHQSPLGAVLGAVGVIPSDYHNGPLSVLVLFQSSSACSDHDVQLSAFS
jgi:hypothetical protein